jgi:hypothetical protein
MRAARRADHGDLERLAGSWKANYLHHGANGKTTTTALTGHFAASGVPAQVGATSGSPENRRRRW